MKYCTKCGNKIKDDSKFCTNCGNPTKLEIERRKEEKQKIKKEKNDKFILNLGIALIIISSIVFFTINYNKMSNIFRVLSLFFEMIIFMLISFGTKKMNLKSHKVFYFAGILFIPLIMILIPYYNLIVPFFREGAGLAIYLSICSIICIIICMISNKIFKSNVYLYISCFLLNFLFITLSYSINENIDKYLVFSLLIVINLILSIVCLFKDKSIYSKIFTNYIKFFFIISFIFILYIIFSKTNISNIIFSILSISYILLGYIIIINNKNSILNYLILFINIVTSILFMNNLLNDYNNMKIYLTTLLIIFELLITYLINTKGLKIEVNILTFIICLYEYINAISYNYKVSLVLSLIFMILVIFIIKIEDNNSIKDLLMILFAFILYSFIFSLFKSLISIDITYILMISSIIYSVLYVILKVKNNKYSKIFELFSYIFLIYSCFDNAFSNIFMPSILTQIIWIYYFIFKLIFDDEKNIRNTLLIGSILNLFIVSENLNLNLYYSILLVSTLLILISILFKYKKVNIKYNLLYITGAILFVMCAFIFDLKEYNKIILFLHLAIYILLYLKSLYKKDIKYIFKLLYIIGGFVLINKIVYSFNLPIVITSIIVLFITIVLLITMFLIEADKDKYILSYSLVILIPISDIISEINILNDYNSLIIMAIITIYLFIIIEKILKLKEYDKQIFEILWLILFAIVNLSFDHIISIMFFIILSIFTIFFGIKKERNTFIYYGSTILLICSISQLVKLKSSLVIIITLLLVGVGLIIYSIVKELTKNNKS